MKLLTSATFKNMIASGAMSIENHRAEVNDLNVFPVPDGDTGSNMEATLNGGVAALQTCDSDEIGVLADAMAGGMLVSARGNSGVITSQFFAGFAEGLAHVVRCDVPAFHKAFVSGVKKAYSVVINPTEGTILTVVREGAEAVKHLAKANCDFDDYLPALVEAMKTSLEKTPELLPVLKEAGVIDSGGAGMVYIMEGMTEAETGNLSANLVLGKGESRPTNTMPDLSAFNENSHLDYGYCTEFLLQLTNEKCDVTKFDLASFIAFLQTKGNSIVCFEKGTIVKTHVHTIVPDEVIAEAKKYGDFLTFKMENMALQHNEVLAKREEHAEKANEKHVPLAAVAVCPSDGIAEIFKGYGVRVIIRSTDLTNPSGQDFLDAFDEADADSIFVFANNKNELMVAHQVAEMYKKSWIYVIEAPDIPKGLAAASVMDVVDFSVEDNLARMEKEMEKASSLGICQASHDSQAFDVKIKENDYLGLLNGKIVVAKSSLSACWNALLDKVPGYADKSVLTLVYGQKMKEKDKTQIQEKAIEKNDWIEICPAEGGQDLFYLYGICE